MMSCPFTVAFIGMGNIKHDNKTILLSAVCSKLHRILKTKDDMNT